MNYVKETSIVGMWCTSGMITWPSNDDPPSESDASHGNEGEQLCDWDEVNVFRCQGAKALFICDERLVSQDQRSVHPVACSSVVQKRVVNSTMQAETYQLVDVVDASDLLRAGLADLHGTLDPLDWEVSAPAWCQSVWCTDCKSCHDTLQKLISKSVNNWLGIEFGSWRQNLWLERGKALPNRRMLEDKPELQTCAVDTTVVIAVCLTKPMQEDHLLNVVETNEWCCSQGADAKAVMLRRQLQRG